MTPYDPYMTFDPYQCRPYMELGSVILMTKFGGCSALFVNQVAFLMIHLKIDNLTSNDLFMTFDPDVKIDFFSFRINAHNMQPIRLKSKHVLNF